MGAVELRVRLDPPREDSYFGLVCWLWRRALCLGFRTRGILCERDMLLDGVVTFGAIFGETLGVVCGAVVGWVAVATIVNHTC